MKPEILVDAEGFVAVNKPAGLLSIPDREQSAESLKDILRQQYGEIYTVHRLDRDTSGVILFAKNEEMHRWLSKQFESRTTQKIYNGLVLGKVYETEGLIDQPIGENTSKKGQMTVTRLGKPAQTIYKTLETFTKFSWMEFNILTGRTHQIRVHMKHFGHPIVCDPYYGDAQPILVSSLKKNYKLAKNELEEKPILNRLALHARALRFTDMHEKEVLVEAPLPKDIRATLAQLRK
ncbi:MAG TPA: RluA family pseudouridine synthase [Flavihumibacter sp.]|nr:RluA family pseudouridine synthase [Flavihumibacter sp.]HPZ87945.1 RluA family pseudouridine synthase [Flavihumibacter sp.]